MKRSKAPSGKKNWTEIPNDGVLEKTMQALKANGIETSIVENGEEAKKKVIDLLPEGAEVMTMTSETLRTTGIADEVNNSNRYDSVRNKLNKMDREAQSHEMQKLGAAPEWALGSVHAVTHDGEVLIASNTGSQLPAYAYGSEHVIWVVGAQKVVKDLEEASDRLYEHTLPLEDKRVQKAYGMPHSNASKKLIINKEVKQGRITMILVKEVLGF